MPRSKKHQPVADPVPAPVKKFCVLCGEYFDEVKDQNHREACRDRNKP